MSKSWARIPTILILITLPVFTFFQNCAPPNTFKRKPLDSLPRNCTVNRTSVKTLLSISSFNPEVSGTYNKFVLDPGMTFTSELPQGTKLTLKNFPFPECGPDYYVQYELPEKMNVEQIEAYLRTQPCIEGGHIAHKIFMSMVPNDPSFNNQLHLQTNNTRAPQGWDIFYGANGINRDVIIGIVDGGVAAHTDIRQTAQSQIPSCSPPNSECRHGTHVAGIAAATFNNGVGVAGVMGSHGVIHSANAFQDPNGASEADVVNAIEHAIDNGAEVINMSLGAVGPSSVIQTAVSNAIAMNVTVVVAASNDSIELSANENDIVLPPDPSLPPECPNPAPGVKCYISPASYLATFPGEFLSVASVNANSSATQPLSSFSNFSETLVNMSAPGTETITGGILSTLPGNSYGRLEGTSMSSPVVAGAAALVIGLARSRGYPRPEPQQVVSLIESSGKPIGTLGKVKGNKTLDINALALAANAAFPVGGAPLPSPSPSPGASPSASPAQTICP